MHRTAKAPARISVPSEYKPCHRDTPGYFSEMTAPGTYRYFLALALRDKSKVFTGQRRLRPTTVIQTGGLALVCLSGKGELNSTMFLSSSSSASVALYTPSVPSSENWSRLPKSPGNIHD